MVNLHIKGINVENALFFTSIKDTYIRSIELHYALSNCHTMSKLVIFFYLY